MGKCLSCCRTLDAHNNLSNSNFQQKPLDTTVKIEDSAQIGVQTTTTTITLPNSENNVITDSINKRNSFLESNGDYYYNSSRKSSFNEKKYSASLKTSRTVTSVKLDNKTSSQNSKKERDYSENKIHTLFEQYKDQKEDTILSEGIERFCFDLNVQPEEFVVLILCWNFGATQMCRFTREEFINGCKRLRVDSTAGMKLIFHEMTDEVLDFEKFKDLYRFTYKFGLESEQRVLPTEMAALLWKLVFSQREPPILERWLAFLEKHPHVRGIPRDTWNMFLNFCDAVGNDLSNYDDTEAWPCLFDDFVEYENDKTNQNFDKSKN